MFQDVRRWASRALDRVRPSKKNRKTSAAPAVHLDRRTRRALTRHYQTRARKAMRGPRMTCAGPSEKARQREALRVQLRVAFPDANPPSIESMRKMLSRDFNVATTARYR